MSSTRTKKGKRSKPASVAWLNNSAADGSSNSGSAQWLEFKISAPGKRRLPSAVSTMPSHYQLRTLVTVYSPGFFHQPEPNETRGKENKPGGSCQVLLVAARADKNRICPSIGLKVKVRLVNSHAQVKLNRSPCFGD